MGIKEKDMKLEDLKVEYDKLQKSMELKNQIQYIMVDVQVIQIYVLYL